MYFSGCEASDLLEENAWGGVSGVVQIFGLFAVTTLLVMHLPNLHCAGNCLKEFMCTTNGMLKRWVLLCLQAQK